MEFSRAYKSRRSINLTPLIDIIFLLVVFFLLTSKFVTAEIIDLNISTVEGSADVSAEDESILIVLSDNGKFMLLGEEFELTELGKKIGKIIEENKNKDIILMNKKGVTVQNMVTAMDQIKAAGGSNISFAEGAS